MKRPRIRPELEAAIDHARGDVPLERWINRLIENELARLAENDQALTALLAERRAGK
jgi:hypothetical protein